MWDSENESFFGWDYGCSGAALTMTRQGVKTDGFELRDQSWYVATDIPSDLLVQVGEINFYLHKYPLLSRSGKFNWMIYKSCDPDLSKIELDDLPGGPESFEPAAKLIRDKSSP